MALNRYLFEQLNKKYVLAEGVEDSKITESDKPAATSLRDAQEWIDYDMEHYGRISEETNELVRRAGFEIIKDQYGDYEVTAKDRGRFREAVGSTISVKNKQELINNFENLLYQHIGELDEDDPDEVESIEYFEEEFPRIDDIVYDPKTANIIFKLTGPVNEDNSDEYFILVYALNNSRLVDDIYDEVVVDKDKIIVPHKYLKKYIII